MMSKRILEAHAVCSMDAARLSNDFSATLPVSGYRWNGQPKEPPVE